MKRILCTLALLALPASAATYPYTTSEVTGTTIVTGTCAGWGLTAPVGASSCAATTITRTASGADLVLTNTGTPIAGATYTTSLTVSAWSAGTVTLSVGGTSGTDRGSAATFTEDLTASDSSAVTLTFSADFAGEVTTTVAVQRLQGSATYNPTTATSPYDAPVSGATISATAIEAVMSVEDFPIRYLYNDTPTATKGVLIPAGSVLKWGPDEINKFKSIKFIDTAAGASTVSIVYAKGTP